MAVVQPGDCILQGADEVHHSRGAERIPHPERFRYGDWMVPVVTLHRLRLDNLCRVADGEEPHLRPLRFPDPQLPRNDYTSPLVDTSPSAELRPGAVAHAGEGRSTVHLPSDEIGVGDGEISGVLERFRWNRLSPLQYSLRLIVQQAVAAFERPPEDVLSLLRRLTERNRRIRKEHRRGLRYAGVPLVDLHPLSYSFFRDFRHSEVRIPLLLHFPGSDSVIILPADPPSGEAIRLPVLKPLCPPADETNVVCIVLQHHLHVSRPVDCLILVRADRHNRVLTRESVRHVGGDSRDYCLSRRNDDGDGLRRLPCVLICVLDRLLVLRELDKGLETHLVVAPTGPEVAHRPF